MSVGHIEKEPALDVLIHADWSVDRKKRWMCKADRGSGRWVVDRPSVVCDVPKFIDAAFEQASERRVLLGFDFPIGLPEAYGAQTGFSGFADALPAFGQGAWSSFFDVAEHPSEVSIFRPFYPKTPRKGVSQAPLVTALWVRSFAELMRVCERASTTSKSACCVFWTLGGNQVGKGALSGWRELVRPAMTRDARLWPFEGTLRQLAAVPGVIIAETYPAHAYHLVGASFRHNESKTNQVHRQAKAAAILEWASRKRADLSPELVGDIEDGFGSGSSGEDRFDAFLGLAKMLEVAKGRPERSATAPPLSRWEGWILAR